MNQVTTRPVITTHTLGQHSAQEVFDFVCLKLIEQGERSVQFPSVLGNGNPTCMYRSVKREGAKVRNLKCAVGHLIRNEDYSPAMESGPVTELFGQWSKVLGHGHHIDLLLDLQAAHDNARNAFVPEFIHRALDVAQRHHLDAHILDCALVPA